MSKKEKKEKLNKEIRNCKKCLLWKTRKNTVPGEGPINAKIMIIGEAAGGEEDRLGRPFVGMSGKFLDKLLKIAGIKRDEVFITSCLKCRPVNQLNNSKRE